MALNIKLEGATVLHDALVAPSEDGREVFVFPANLGAPQIDEHPGKRTVVVSLPTSTFEQISNELIAKGRVTLARAPRVPRYRSGVEAHEVDYEIDPAAGGNT